MRGSLKTAVVVVALTVGVLAIGGIASSDIRVNPYALFFSVPIPCHVYIKEKHSVASRPGYVPDSFFQVHVQFLKMEPDVTTIHPKREMLQGALDFLLSQQQNPKYAERYDKEINDIRTDLKDVEDHPKVLILRVLETLEGRSPGKEIIMPFNRFSRWYLGKLTGYMLGYQGLDGKIYGSAVDTNDLYERDDWFLTDIKRWVRRLFSECDNV